ncbi:MAG: Glu-tRNA(Gln) amidotransferase subunit GatE [Candidatus Woesearchaeota archaeon]|jgi:Glu-tRNA(Gln) amidotransferase subunit E-like FAD-binding protein|nr:Glu-tRNA(Gln) amidotransferase subunit GatE [Candidatus Woesearchaeota archaeon]
MTDYSKLGFKCGIEIHQQLEGKKLFCNCLTLNSTNQPDVKIERRLRASAGEMGKIDAAAKYEMSKSKLFIYESSSEDTCLVELDEEPPHPMNQEALTAAIEVALLLNAKIVDEVQVMRKTVVDGSNVSGFQRTSLIATDGYIETSQGKVKIDSICLEEEAAQKLDTTKDYTKYKLDRLGIPLIELGTAPDIKSPEHAKEVASQLGMILRSTGKCKRGIGTIRQDVNISIRNGARTEVKGFQDLKSIPKVIEYEVHRQLEDIKKGNQIEAQVRKSESDLKTSFLRPMPGAERMYPETDVPQTKITKEFLEEIKPPQLLTEKSAIFEKKYKLSPELTKELLHNELFEKLVEKYKDLKPQEIANILVNTPKEIKSRLNLDISEIQDSDYDIILSYLDQKKIPKSAVIELLADVCKGNKLNISKYKVVEAGNLESEIKKIVEQKPGLNPSAYMGIVMGKYRGKVDGKKVMEILKKIVK